VEVPGAMKVVTVAGLPLSFRLRRDHYSRVVFPPIPEFAGL
jgi:hypothetical protein